MAEHEHDETYGMALGFRIFETDGQMYLAEAEIAPYMDDPKALGATLVFHLIEGLDPSSAEEEEWPAWPTDIDDELDRDEGAPMADQFRAIARQLARIGDAQLAQYLSRARTEAEEAEAEAEGS
jgi:hypothetical protein